MSITLKLTFPAGRYHATPWGRHVNEGVPEWPPSPWRLLRALVAIWKRTCPAVPEQQIRRVLEPLLRPPFFRLPAFRVAHTRHYMPWEKKGPNDRTLVFDTFVAIGRKDPLFVGWPDADLLGEDRGVLEKLIGNVTSFGRAEGWVHAELTEETITWNCCPAEPGAANPISVLCPDPSTAFDSEHYPKHDPKKLKKGLRPGERLFDCPRWHLCLDTQTIHAERWPRVPGTTWVNYTRSVEMTSAPKSVRQPRPLPTLARFAMDGPVLPLLEFTVPLAERVRSGLLHGYCRLRQREKYGKDIPPNAERFGSRTFSGKDADGRPLQGHRHAYYLATDEDGDGRLDHVTVYAAGGFDRFEVQALAQQRWLSFGEGEPLRLLLEGLGNEQLPGVPLLAKAAVWESSTPWVATRFPKRNGRKRDPEELLDCGTSLEFARHVLGEELERLRMRQPELPEVVQVEPLKAQHFGPRRLRLLSFQRGRSKYGDNGGRRSWGAFRIRFAGPVQGPLCLGYGCHFGLGLFLPVAEEGG